jgi:hypothetical protein
MPQSNHLDDLTIEELSDLSDAITVLAKTCAPMIDAYWQPRFDLTPGCEVIIRTGWIMPGLAADPVVEGVDPEKLDYASAPPDMFGGKIPVYYGDGDPAWLNPQPVPRGCPWPIVGPLVAAGVFYWKDRYGPQGDVETQQTGDLSPTLSPAEAAPAAETADRSEDRPTQEPAGEATGAEGGSAPPAPVEPVDPPPAAPAARTMVWTPAIDAQLIEAVAHRLADGSSITTAIRMVASGMDLPVGAAAARIHTKFRAQVDARADELKAELQARMAEENPAGPPAGAKSDPLPPTDAAAAPGEGPEEPEGVTVPADGSAPAVAGAGVSELGAWLARVKRDGIWTLTRDRDLMHFLCLQWPANDIALELQVPASEIKPRIAALTCSRKWPNSAVRDELERMAASEAA